ncbi:MAG: MBL fold metallo-hydrolase [Planctomycetes bacterium]|nr:MBL fold metallo-hydrolase [Planctomycetota bacterium]
MKWFAVLVACVAFFPASLLAQDDAKKVKLRWFGQSMFQLETAGGKSIVFDPQMMPIFSPPRLTADVTLISHPHNDHNQVEILKEKGRVFEGVKVGKGTKTDWVTVDEKVGAIRIRNLGNFHDAVNGMQRGKNSSFIVETDGLVFCHLGDLGHELTADQVKTIGKVDVLMIPVGGIYTLNGDQAKKVVEQIKPRLYILPMHYGVPGFDDILGPSEFLDEQKNVKKMLDTNELEIPVDLKADNPTIVMLGWRAPAKVDPKKEPEKKP